LQGVDNPNPSGQQFTVEDTFTPLRLADRVGWRFTGWSPASITPGTARDIEFVAQWALIQYSITYADWNYPGVANPNTRTSFTIQNAEELFTPLALTGNRVGWTFTGWSLASIILPGYPDIDNITFTAQWESVPPILIEFKSGTEGVEITTNPNPNRIFPGQRIELERLPNTNTHNFAGWFDADGNTVTHLHDGGPLVLYARWNERTGGFLGMLLNFDMVLLLASIVVFIIAISALFLSIIVRRSTPRKINIR